MSEIEKYSEVQRCYVTATEKIVNVPLDKPFEINVVYHGRVPKQWDMLIQNKGNFGKLMVIEIGDTNTEGVTRIVTQAINKQQILDDIESGDELTIVVSVTPDPENSRVKPLP